MVTDEKEMRKAGRKGWMMKAWESEWRWEDGGWRMMGWGGWGSGREKSGRGRQRARADGGLLIICGMHTDSY